MGYWEFISVLHTLSNNNLRESGKSIVREGLTDGEKSMIERKKTLNTKK